MNHLKIYENLVYSRQSLNRKKYDGIYYERHHIIPKCMGGDDTHDNLVLLSAREHFLVHWLLAKAYPTNFKLQCGWNAFNRSLYRPVSRYYEYARLNFIKHLIANEDRKLKNSITVSQQRWVNDGVTSTRVHYEVANKMINDGWNSGRLYFKRTSPTKETREKMSNSNTGKQLSQDTKDKISVKSKNNIWINNGSCSKFIDKNILDSFISDGWVEGRIIKGKLKSSPKVIKQIKGTTWVYKDTINDRIPLEKLEEYLNDGWFKGRYLTEEVKESLRFHASKKEK
jgi:hypothetical protein